MITGVLETGGLLRGTNERRSNGLAQVEAPIKQACAAAATAGLSIAQQPSQQPV
jgi:hypothetical protein